MTFKMFTDGGARGNPGPAGIGYLIKNEQEEVVQSRGKYIGVATNNQAEYTALIEGLEAAIDKKIKVLSCVLDSELVVKQMNKLYKVKDAELKDLWIKAQELTKHFEKIDFTHVRRENNKEADALVNQALDGHISSNPTWK